MKKRRRRRVGNRNKEKEKEKTWESGRSRGSSRGTDHFVDDRSFDLYLSESACI